MCIELVGDRFLRRMVRLLVEASIRLVAIADVHQTETSAKKPPTETMDRIRHGETETVENDDRSAEDALIELIERQDRTLVGRPAPPDGLLFVGARVQSD